MCLFLNVNSRITQINAIQKWKQVFFRFFDECFRTFWCMLLQTHQLATLFLVISSEYGCFNTISRKCENEWRNTTMMFSDGSFNGQRTFSRHQQFNFLSLTLISFIMSFAERVTHDFERCIEVASSCKKSSNTQL